MIFFEIGNQLIVYLQFNFICKTIILWLNIYVNSNKCENWNYAKVKESLTISSVVKLMLYFVRTTLMNVDGRFIDFGSILPMTGN